MAQQKSYYRNIVAFLYVESPQITANRGQRSNLRRPKSVYQIDADQFCIAFSLRNKGLREKIVRNS